MRLRAPMNKEKHSLYSTRSAEGFERDERYEFGRDSFKMIVEQVVVLRRNVESTISPS